MSEYNFSTVEQKWQSYWEKNKTFKIDGAPKGPKFYCLDMFPYPSGAGLHVGHPLGYTASDIVCRYKRMRGFSVLHPMGFDAFGLPAEQHAVLTGEHPSGITRESCDRYTAQLKRVGFSYDWDRMLATCTEDYYKWTQWIFLKLYDSWFDEQKHKARPISELPIPAEIKSAGQAAVTKYKDQHRLAFYTDAMVNWCPALGTVLANEEVINGRSERGDHEVIRKPMKQWMLRITSYAERLLSDLKEIDWPENIKEQQVNWIGRKEGAEIDFPLAESDAYVTAFTTRPDTLFGVTFFVVSPEHPIVPALTTPEQKAKVEKYCEEAAKASEFARTLENRKKTGVFTGGHVLNPITQELIPVYVGDYVLMSYGTGAVMGVPAHDDRDFEFARTFQIEIRPVIKPVGEEDEITNAVIEGEVAWTKPGIMLPIDAPAAKDLGLEGRENKAAHELICSWLQKHGRGRRVVNYKLRDWLFSRQRYWGEPIPLIHWEDGEISMVPESELPLVLPEVSDYKPSSDGQSPLAKATDWLQVVDSKTGRKGRRETNTMPQWAGSCWYYLRFIDPKNANAAWERGLEKSWMPVDLYIGGAEHAVLHLLYARFWHKVLFDLGEASTNEPFHKLVNQGMVQAFAFKNKRGALIPSDQVVVGADGVARHTEGGEELERIIAKMSKSLRNVVSLDEVVNEFGADTFRMYLMFMGPLDSSRPWDPKAITGNHRFLKKAWSFVIGNEEGPRATVSEDAEPMEAKRAINRLVKKVGEDIESMSFNTAVSAYMEFINEVSSMPVSMDTVKRFILTLSPFAPHIAEEMWERLGAKKSLAYEGWPAFDAKYLAVEKLQVVVQVKGKKRAVLDVAVGVEEAVLKNMVVESLANTEHKVSLSDKFITVYQPGTKNPKLVNVIPN